MSKSFDMTMKNEDIKFLRRNYPNAFILMFEIMDVYERRPGKKLNIGEACIGDFETYGMKRKQYRYALGKLVELGHIGIIRATKKGTIVSVLNDKIICRNIPKEIMKKYTPESKILEISEEEDFLEEKIAMGHQRGHQKNEFRAIKSMDSNNGISIVYDAKENSLGHQENEFGAIKGATCLYSIKEEEYLNKKKNEKKKKAPASQSHNKISLNRELGIYENIQPEQIEKWKKLFPKIDVDYQIAKAAKHHSLSKIKRTNHEACINYWLTNCYDNYEDSKVSISSPKSIKITTKSWIEKTFKKGEFYNGAECNFDQFGIGFTRGFKHGQIKFDGFGEKAKLNALIDDFGIDPLFKMP